MATRRGPPISCLATAETSGSTVIDVIEQVGDAAAVQGGDRPRLAEAEAPELGGQRVLDRVVGLVGDEDDGPLGRAQHPHHVLVGRGRADVDVDDEQHGVGEVDGDLGLSGDGGVDAPGVRLPAAGVDDGEAAAEPLRLVRDAVARDAGGVLDDGLAAAEDAVDERATCRRSGGPTIASTGSAGR